MEKEKLIFNCTNDCLIALVGVIRSVVTCTVIRNVSDANPSAGIQKV